MSGEESETTFRLQETARSRNIGPRLGNELDFAACVIDRVIVLSRARVDLARRSSFQTTITSPGRIWSSIR